MIDDKHFPAEGKIFSLRTIHHIMEQLAHVEKLSGNVDFGLKMDSVVSSLADAVNFLEQEIDAKRGDNVVRLDKHRKK